MLSPSFESSPTVDPWQLGASLYVPALHPKLDHVLARREYPVLKSVIVCTEDAIAERDLDSALRQLREVVRTLRPAPGLLRFVRARNPAVLREVLGMPGSEWLDGFVLPKVTSDTLAHYLQPLHATAHRVMPTLETAEVFEPDAMRALRTELMRPGVRERVLALRIGGNDLMRVLGIRRPRGITLYDTPLGTLLAQLVLIFRPHGFALTAPVFDLLDSDALLCEEVRRDLAFGFSGKTAIHPAQVSLIESVFRVQSAELDAARRLADANGPAVFKLDGAMHEAAVHGPWARQVFARAYHFGVAA
jgi:citrate lyase beta subunit